jgi:hypothetical protein
MRERERERERARIVPSHGKINIFIYILLKKTTHNRNTITGNRRPVKLNFSENFP